MKRIFVIMFLLLAIGVGSTIYSTILRRPFSTTNVDMQITQEKATMLAEEKINENTQQVMVVKEVQEKGDGWLFFYDSQAAVASGDVQKDGVPGNVPLFVGKDGSVRYVTNPSSI